MGRLYERQNCLLQSAQVLPWTLFSAPSVGRISRGDRARASCGSSRKKRRFEDVEGAVGLSAEGGASRGMMVLLVLQVHLQKDVGAAEGE